MSDDRVRVILADDHTLVRDGIRRILEGEADITVVDEAADGHAAVDAVARTEADVLVLDLTMPGRDGLEVLAHVARLRPALRVIVLTMHAGREYVARATQEGAAGYLLKDSAVQDLVNAVRAVVGGGTYYSPAIRQQLDQPGDASRAPQGVQSLTDRERDVLRLLVRGLSSRDIGAALDISARTVETHRANLMRKLGVKSVALLTQMAIREGLADPAG
ncbi:MAG: response regulator transcription factor [Acidobacteria bacterium]|jgi:DNA-binding NarL/FixJ family response regulator|nr:response regulator transcription factor [Acidobacteriota bacterium]